VTRLVYFAFIMVGMFGDMGMLGKEVKAIVHWSPYGTVKSVVSAAMVPSQWANDTTFALLVTLGYSTIFAFLGIRWFKWNTK
jgi:ABC-2 type transport system permease protein